MQLRQSAGPGGNSGNTFALVDVDNQARELGILTAGIVTADGMES